MRSLNATHALMLICYTHKYCKAGNATINTTYPQIGSRISVIIDHNELFEMNVVDTDFMSYANSQNTWDPRKYIDIVRVELLGKHRLFKFDWELEN
jgi:hypothetical protein